PEQVQHRVVADRGVTGGEQFLVGEETAVADRRVDAGQVLVDDPACAEVHVADFGIAHLPVGKADMHAGGMDQRMRTVGQQAVAGAAAWPCGGRWRPVPRGDPSRPGPAATRAWGATCVDSCGTGPRNDSGTRYRPRAAGRTPAARAAGNVPAHRLNPPPPGRI